MTDELRHPAPSRKRDLADQVASMRALLKAYASNDASSQEVCTFARGYDWSEIEAALRSDKDAPGYVRGLEDAAKAATRFTCPTSCCCSDCARVRAAIDDIRALAAQSAAQIADEPLPPDDVLLKQVDDMRHALELDAQAAQIAAPQDVTQSKDGYKLSQGVPAPAESATPSDPRNAELHAAAMATPLMRSLTRQSERCVVDASIYHLMHSVREKWSAMCARYERANSDWHLKMPDDWPVEVVMTMRELRQLAAAPAAQPNAELPMGWGAETWGAWLRDRGNSFDPAVQGPIFNELAAWIERIPER